MPHQRYSAQMVSRKRDQASVLAASNAPARITLALPTINGRDHPSHTSSVRT